MRSPPNKVEHLYVHVPFCAAKCNYCAFYSESGSAAKMSDYVDAAVAELNSFVGAASRPRLDLPGRDREVAPTIYDLQPTTIFFGGGTPSLLPTPLMRRVLEAVGNLCSRGVSRGPTEAHASATDAPLEWTIECNPSTVSTEKANLFREFGVNRISMGVQSLDDDLLETLGRVHSVKAAVASYEKLRVAGFDNINLDLMFGLPGQTLEHWRNTLERAISLQPEHISTYCLIFEEDTHFWSLLQKGLIKPDEELELAMYELGHRDAHRRRLPAIRDQQFREARPRVPTQHRVLGRQRLSGPRPQRLLDDRQSALAECAGHRSLHCRDGEGRTRAGL